MSQPKNLKPKKSFRCPMCGDELASKFSLKRHFDGVSCVNQFVLGANKSGICDNAETATSECSKGLIQPENLHIACHICYQKLPIRVELISHLNVNHLFHAQIETTDFDTKEGKHLNL